ncbi:Conserved hypothetical protein [Candidatus Protochlamydia naegleriophila]|uniref:PI3K/PI4K catalytic domain-containing protein n=1 Tax=Candidatus Protochlamydia naegleriophila TaxID=389348 RepID=A0A0U5J9Z9_9BACT|nr:hypothetical protein [Candidatus Protochlamydia naegleriophila]CUI15927.1 Conserved hypothetical protein [Candidatus Protochlamydia naegleriophila]
MNGLPGFSSNNPVQGVVSNVSVSNEEPKSKRQKLKEVKVEPEVECEGVEDSHHLEKHSTILLQEKMLSKNLQSQVVGKVAVDEQKPSSLDIITEKICQCFNFSPIELNKRLNGKELNLENLADLCSGLIDQKLRSGQSISAQEVIQLNDLLFNTELVVICAQYSEINDLVNPHPVGVIASLFDCIQHMDGKLSFEEEISRVTDYIETKPDIKKYPSVVESIEINNVLPVFQRLMDNPETPTNEKEAYADAIKEYTKYKEDVKNWQLGLSQFPIVDTKEFLKSNNCNEAYVLNGKTNGCQWIFKPPTFNNQNLPINEFLASKVNGHGQFPIPLTILIHFKNVEGSAQIFIRDAKSLDDITMKAGELVKKNSEKKDSKEDEIGDSLTLEEAYSQVIDMNQIQALVIFDLLFGNTDRHQANILFQGSRPFGIDHDSCFQGLAKEYLKMDYLELISDDKQFSQEVRVLFSSGNIEQYQQIMRENKMPKDAVIWLQDAAFILNEQMEKGLPIKDIVGILKEEWEKRFDF